MPLSAGYRCRKEFCTREHPVRAAHQVGQPQSEIMPTSTESARHLGIYLAEPGTPHYDAMILLDVATPATSDRLPHSNADA